MSLNVRQGPASTRLICLIWTEEALDDREGVGMLTVVRDDRSSYDLTWCQRAVAEGLATFLDIPLNQGGST